MVWQRAGTVAVQNGSTTVVGTSVDFAASSRNGDSFVGPDGATYELANVASSTVISILPAYKGPTVSGAAYAIMPVQGYDKMLSDAFNNLNNQFGPKLAALGTTGNYDVLPPTKGGTGRIAIGTAVGADVTTSNTDATPGRVLRVADFGIGASAAPYITDFNSTTLTGGLHRFGSEAVNGPPVAGFGTLIHAAYDMASGNWTQHVAYMGLQRGFFRSGINGTRGPWNETYSTGNTTRMADGTLKAI